MKKWEHDIVNKARYGYNIDFETKRIAHLILDREEKVLAKQLDALEDKEIALAEELARVQQAMFIVRRKRKQVEDNQVDIE